MKTKLMMIRKAAGYKSRDIVADKLSMSASTYKDWEMGRTDIKASDLCKLADFFEVSVDRLLGRDDSTASTQKAPSEALTAFASLTPEWKRIIEQLVIALSSSASCIEANPLSTSLENESTTNNSGAGNADNSVTINNYEPMS